MIEGNLSDEDKALVKALGGWDKLMETLKAAPRGAARPPPGRLEMDRHRGDEPVRRVRLQSRGHPHRAGKARNRSAIKVWDERTFRNLDDSVELNTRNIKIALRRLRRFAREGVPEELDLDGDDRRHREKRRLARSAPACRSAAIAVKVLLFLDVGGSMDPHVQVCEELFSAAKSEFRHLEYFYFHNCVYDYVWRDNRRRRNERIATFDLLHKYGPRLEAGLRRRRGDEPVRAHAAGRQRRIHERRAGRRLAQATDRAPIATRSGSTRSPSARGATRARRRSSWRYSGRAMFPLTLDGLQRGIAALRK